MGLCLLRSEKGLPRQNTGLQASHPPREIDVNAVHGSQVDDDGFRSGQAKKRRIETVTTALGENGDVMRCSEFDL
jgi:hypothetical protein